MSFRFKTILGIVFIQAALLILLTWYGINTLKSSNDQELQKRAATAATLFASTTKNAVLASDLAALESFVSELLTNPDLIYARVIGKQAVLAEGGDRAALAKTFSADKHFEDVGDAVFDTYADINIAGEKYGRIELGFSIKPLEDVLAQARTQLYIFAVLALTLVLIFSYFLGNYLTRGLNALKAASGYVAEGHFGYQIKVQGQDELGQTAAAFNAMSSKLALLDDNRTQAEAEIRHLNSELEERVELRTSQLESLNKELEYRSLHDSLTQLPNRTLFQDRLAQTLLLAQRNKNGFALMTVDLDRFKQINDILGHQTGDLVLQEVAGRMRRLLRQSDTVARVGGDEFLLLLPTASSPEQAAVAATKLLQALNEPLVISGQSIDIGASIGVAVFPEHGEDTATLLRHSDSAMYVAKRSQSGYTIYNLTLDSEDAERLSLNMDLRQAISGEQLTLHYQPKIDFATHQVSGVEALVRWQHPRLGLIFPDDFLPIAEKSGIMRQLTIAVMHLALRQAAIWVEAGRNLTIAINISATNLQDTQFPDDVALILKQHKVPPATIELEITEPAIMSDPLRAIENIRKLNGMGLQIAIDDFGTGYSSMAYLRKLLVARIKIDKSFVMDMHQNENDEIIVKSTVDLGHNLGLTVVAEGVETQAAWDKLKALGCDSAQGYLMGRPIPAAEFDQWMESSTWGLPSKKRGELPT